MVPQCLTTQSWGQSIERNWIDQFEKTRGHEYWPGVESLAFELIAQIEQEHSVDVTRRYVTGQSLGGDGSWHFITTRPGMFAAAVPMCGRADPANAERISQTAVWAFIGQEERPASVNNNREVIEAMRQLGSTPHYTELEGEGHGHMPAAYDTPGLLDWVFAQRREA